MTGPSDFTAPSGPMPSPDSGASPAPPAPEVPVSAPEAPAAFPSKSELGGWYDAPKSTEELDRGKLEAAAPGQAKESTEPSAESKSMLSEHQLPNYQDYTPPGMEPNSFNRGVLTEYRQALNDPNPQTRHNRILDMYASEAKRMQAEMAQHQRTVWDRTNMEWMDQTRKEFGSRLESELSTGKAVVEMYGGSPAQQKQLIEFLNYTGAGNNVAMIRLLSNIGKQLNVFETMSANPSPGRGAPGGDAGRRGWYNRS